MTASPLDRPLATLHRDLRAGTVTAGALVQDGMERQRRYGEVLGAYIYRDDDGILAQARVADGAFAVGADCGPLQGLPVSVKDLYGVDHWPLYAGSPKRLPALWERDATVVAAVRRQLGVLTGKTHTVEFAFGGLGTNPHWPVPRNPWDARRHRVPGGSSAGAGVSLHSDALIAIGTDTAGSGRIPASMTGVVGVKTSYGRWPLAGVVPLSPSFDSAALLTRTAGDARFAWHAFDAALSGTPLALQLPERSVRGCRFGVCETALWEECSPGVAEAVSAALDQLAGAGARLVRMELPEIVPALELFHAGHLAAPEFHEFLHSELPDWLPSLDPKVAARVGDAGALSAHEYLRRKRRLGELTHSAARRFDGIDALLAPTVPITAPVVGELDDLDTYRRANLLALRNTCVANLLHLCAMSLPAGLDAAGIPVGLQLIAPLGADADLVALGEACERVLGTPAERIGRPPAVPATD